MEHKIYNLQAGLLVGFTCALAVALGVNAVQAVAGNATFSYWHWITLLICVRLTRASVSWVTMARWIIILKTLLRKAGNSLQRAFTSTSRAVRSLAALFTLHHERMREDIGDPGSARGRRIQVGQS